MLMKLRLQMSGSLFQPKNNNSSFEIYVHISLLAFSLLLLPPPPPLHFHLLAPPRSRVIIVNTANIVNKETGFLLPWIGKWIGDRQLHSFRIESPVRVSSSTCP